MADGDGDADDSEALPSISVSKFDYSVENHFKLMDEVAMCSGESEFEYEQSEVQRLRSSVTFLSKWRDFRYQTRVIKFACENKPPLEEDVTSQINLTQFSSVAVPKGMPDGNPISSPLSKDFVMYVGGHVWALDWCPRVHQNSTFDTNLEFIAVSAHPPESSYHKIGAPLTGRGLIQIWCMLNTGVNDQDLTPVVKVKGKQTGRPRKKPTDLTTVVKVKGRPRGRPRKKPLDLTSVVKVKGKPRKKLISESLISFDGSNEHNQLLLEYNNNSPKKRPHSFAVDFFNKISRLSPEIFAKRQLNNKALKVYTRRPKDTKSTLTKCQTWRNSKVNGQDVALPRLVMGLAHNGKVAWDVKWRPYDSCHYSKHIMGYLAVLLGNGSLEVWEVPHPHMIKTLFSSCQLEGADPRFLMLKPVFLCSKLKCGDRQSIPLTVEWSASAPHDLILAGCHDGRVALWKFSANGLPKDTRPLLCFNADTGPIRALKWAPVSSDPESVNIIVTAGFKGLKFWDIRDPLQPLWDVPAQKIINSIDWLPDPSCIVLSFDNGVIKTISLVKAACDTPVTGVPCNKTQHFGSYDYCCSSSSIWSVQVSKLTGMAAYCCSDGKVIHFKLTTQGLNDPGRMSQPHYLCGSQIEENSTLTLLSPLPNIPFPMRKSTNQWSDTPKSKRGVLSRSNQEKRAKDHLSKCQKLLSGKTSGSEGTMVVAQNKEPESQTNLALMCIDNDNKSEEENDDENFPSKIVAIHRVRWNMNKGSERLLCYGGAAGIVRCQVIK